MPKPPVLRVGAAKRCRACNRVKPIELFHVHRNRLDGRSSNCAVCDNIALRMRRRRCPPQKDTRTYKMRRTDAYLKKNREYQRIYRKTPLGRVNRELAEVRRRLRKWRVTAEARERRYKRILAELLARREKLHKERDESRGSDDA